MSATAISALYTVALGDSLSKIAARFYGDPSKYALIAERNNINPQAMLMVGQRLIIPPSVAPGTVQEVSVTDVAPISVTAPSGGAVVEHGIETVTSTASVWYKDWRYWAVGAVAVGALWYFTRGRR